MKKIRLLAAALVLLSFSSCFYTMHGVTNNPIGNKKGIAKAGLFGGKDFGYATAAKNGKLSTIGTWEIKVGFMSVGTTLTGDAGGSSGSDKKSK